MIIEHREVHHGCTYDVVRGHGGGYSVQCNGRTIINGAYSLRLAVSQMQESVARREVKLADLQRKFEAEHKQGLDP